MKSCANLTKTGYIKQLKIQTIAKEAKVKGGKCRCVAPRGLALVQRTSNSCASTSPRAEHVDLCPKDVSSRREATAVRVNIFARRGMMLF